MRRVILSLSRVLDGLLVNAKVTHGLRVGVPERVVDDARVLGDVLVDAPVERLGDVV